MSAMMSMFFMYSNVSFEKGVSAWLNDSQTKSKESMFSVSGIERPWSIGTSFRFYGSLYEDSRLSMSSMGTSTSSVTTRMLHSLRSRLSIRKSKTAILWMSSAVNRSDE